MDTTLTTQEEQQINDAIDEYASRKQIEGGAQEIFCENWDIVKEVLDFLKSVLPQPIPAIIGILIKVGDAAHRKWCQQA